MTFWGDYKGENILSPYLTYKAKGDKEIRLQFETNEIWSYQCGHGVDKIAKNGSV